MVDFQSQYISIAGNRHPSSADWDHKSGLLAFGADQNVALWKPLSTTQRGIQRLLYGHDDLVTAVKFFQPDQANGRSLIVSGSVDTTIRLWSLSESEPDAVAVLRSHTSSINCLAVSAPSRLLVSGSADASIKIWQIDTESASVQATLTQTISVLPRFFPLSLALHPIGARGDYVLATAGTRKTIEVYVAPHKGSFEHQASVAGHEGWIRSLSIGKEGSTSDDDLLLASASQDKTIRLWRIAGSMTQLSDGEGGIVENFEHSLSNKRFLLRGSEVVYLLTFEALLLGHDDWIYSTSWQWQQRTQHLRLLSSSADNSVAMWEPDSSSGVWLCTNRFGEISLQKGSTTATGSTGGFWNSLWAPSGEAVVCLARTGSWRVWVHEDSQDRWVQDLGITGHMKSVTDIAWTDDGTYFLSTSKDQTTRLHAKCLDDSHAFWCEIARPQIHGYDLNCISSICGSQFISGADEKLLRVFDEPLATAELLGDLCGVSTSSTATLPSTARIPVLGLSNKVEEVDSPSQTPANAKGDGEPEAINNHSSSSESRYAALTEDRLAKNSLWPEREKIYGHGHEISAVTTSHDATVVATSCKASSLDHATIRLFGIADWREVQPSLRLHSLTVTALSFSDDDEYLLSVGRDRQWGIFARQRHEKDKYALKHSLEKGHARMILDGRWAPLCVGYVFGTAGRDKNVKLWSISNDGVANVATIGLANPVTSISFVSSFQGTKLIMAVGTEEGTANIYGVQPSAWTIKSEGTLPTSLRSRKAVKRLQWRPGQVEEDGKCLELAIASDDSTLQIFRVSVDLETA